METCPKRKCSNVSVKYDLDRRTGVEDVPRLSVLEGHTSPSSLLKLYRLVSFRRSEVRVNSNNEVMDFLSVPTSSMTYFQTT